MLQIETGCYNLNRVLKLYDVNFEVSLDYITRPWGQTDHRLIFIFFFGCWENIIQKSVKYGDFNGAKKKEKKKEQTQKVKQRKGWRDGSKVKSRRSSSRKPRFNSQYQYNGSQLSVIPCRLQPSITLALYSAGDGHRTQT